jgi:hypothetical protein
MYYPSGQPAFCKIIGYVAKVKEIGGEILIGGTLFYLVICKSQNYYSQQCALPSLDQPFYSSDCIDLSNTNNIFHN